MRSTNKTRPLQTQPVKDLLFQFREMEEERKVESGFQNPTKQACEMIFGAGNLEYQVEQFIKSGGQSVKILLSGKTGVGKSHLTNALIGKELAKEGETLDAITDVVTGYPFEMNNVTITVFDTPGLADGQGKDEEYLNKIKAQDIKFDLFLFCTEMNSVRFRNDDRETLRKLTQILGQQVWKNAVVVLTFANEVRPPPTQKGNDVSEKQFFNNRFLEFKRKIKDILKELDVCEDTAVNVPFVPAGVLNEPRLPDRDNWLTAVWVAVFKRINRNAKAPFLLANVDRIAFTSLSFAGGLQSRGPSPEDMQAIAGNRKKLQATSFEEKLIGCLQKPRVYDEFGHKCIIREDQTATVHSIEMDEGSSQDIVQELLGEDSGNLVGSLVNPAFEYVYQNFFGWIIKYLRKRNT